MSTVVLSGVAVLLGAGAAVDMADGRWLQASGGISAALGTVALAAFARVLRTAWHLPDWARSFEAAWAPQGLVLRCNRCDQIVVPWVRAATMPRLLSYAHYHVTDVCGRATAAQPGEVTERMPPLVRPVSDLEWAAADVREARMRRGILPRVRWMRRPRR